MAMPHKKMAIPWQSAIEIFACVTEAGKFIEMLDAYGTAKVADSLIKWKVKPVKIKKKCLLLGIIADAAKIYIELSVSLT